MRQRAFVVPRTAGAQQRRTRLHSRVYGRCESLRGDRAGRTGTVIVAGIGILLVLFLLSAGLAGDDFDDDDGCCLRRTVICAPAPTSNTGCVETYYGNISGVFWYDLYPNYPWCFGRVVEGVPHSAYVPECTGPTCSSTPGVPYKYLGNASAGRPCSGIPYNGPTAKIQPDFGKHDDPWIDPDGNESPAPEDGYAQVLASDGLHEFRLLSIPRVKPPVGTRKVGVEVEVGTAAAHGKELYPAMWPASNTTGSTVHHFILVWFNPGFRMYHVTTNGEVTHP